MTGAEQASGLSDLRPMQSGGWSGLGFLVVVVAEFQRARAAAQRYERLRRAGPAALAREGIVPADIPRRVFEEFYH